MPALTTIALTAAATAMAAQTGYSIYAGEKGAKAQKNAMRRQEQAQKQAEARALSQQRSSEQAMAAANRKKPDISAIMQAAQEAGNQGAASTMLTGPKGVNPDDLDMAKTSLLGQ